MRKILLALAVSLTVFVAGTLPASAAWPVTKWRFWNSNVCMAIGDTTLNAGAIAAKWNAVSGYVVDLHSANNCVTTGYPPSRRFTIDTMTDPGQAWCVKVTDVNGNMLVPGGGSYGDGEQGPDGWYLYNNNPRAWINTNCVWWPTYKAHLTSAAIGYVLGLYPTNSAGYNSRVMNFTEYSVKNIPYPDNPDGSMLRTIYLGDCASSPDC